MVKKKREEGEYNVSAPSVIFEYLNPTDRGIYLAIKSLTYNGKRDYLLSVNEIALRAGCNYETANRSIGRLVMMGFINILETNISKKSYQLIKNILPMNLLIPSRQRYPLRDKDKIKISKHMYEHEGKKPADIIKFLKEEK